MVKSDTEGRDLFYRFDTVGRFHASQSERAAADPRRFLRFEALGKAILHAKDPGNDAYRGLRLPPHAVGHPGMPKRSVVLIDEIDKAPRDVPNDLLVEIENLCFEIPELAGADEAPVRVALSEADRAHRPIVVITSNSERALPDAFLRRCVYHHLELPPFRADLGADAGETLTVDTIVSKRLGTRYAGTGSTLVDEALGFFRYLRGPGRGLERAPSLGELLNWLDYLLPGEEQGSPAASLAALGEAPLVQSVRNLLLKNPDDQARAAELLVQWPKAATAADADPNWDQDRDQGRARG